MTKKPDFEELEVMIYLHGEEYCVFTHKQIETLGFSSTANLKKHTDKQSALNYAVELATSLKLLISYTGFEIDDKDREFMGVYLNRSCWKEFVRMPWIYIKIDQSVEGPRAYSSYDRMEPSPGYQLHPAHAKKHDVVIPRSSYHQTEADGTQ